MPTLLLLPFGRRIYPQNNNEEKYSQLFEQSSSLCAETAASKARNELVKYVGVA